MEEKCFSFSFSSVSVFGFFPPTLDVFVLKAGKDLFKVFLMRDTNIRKRSMKLDLTKVWKITYQTD